MPISPMRRSRRYRPFGRGQALLETALSIPMLLALVWGVLGFGRLYAAQLAILNASREGARLGALGQSASRIEQTVLENLADMNLALISQVAVHGAGGKTGEQVQVLITTPIANPVAMPGLPERVSLLATCTMRIE
ncbi:MAG: pilus assembly protein [Cyanobacteria bacterium NC_groundwater_1444_Ag_S-0.65um_54_12]|nr:pilus assembly protein [Cyanobacteria bacterium NC_groundwater_1444_Ag_S-0.65um_54_12]